MKKFKIRVYGIVQGEMSAWMRFLKDLKTLASERSVILKMDVTEQKRSGDIFVSLDIAICPTCKTE